MCQQTQATRVVPYYERWLSRFPDVASLAAAPAADVLGLWSGLGYNRRALALQGAARHVAAQGWPDDLTDLPGVGPYTAAAVASFAWDAQVASVDTNVRRVIGRWEGEPALALPAARRRAAELVPEGRAAAFNQAMMELGATVCMPRRARCDACPVAAGCRSAGRVAPPPPRRRGERFEDTTRYARGRVLAALLHGTPDGLADERRDAAVAALERDGLVVRGPDGLARLPD
jgi:A/G-specific adenine glycosylase